MPPHCDSMDGPVVKAARRALETGTVNLVLPYVPKEVEAGVICAFDRVGPLRAGTLKRFTRLGELQKCVGESLADARICGGGAGFAGMGPQVVQVRVGRTA